MQNPDIPQDGQAGATPLQRFSNFKQRFNRVNGAADKLRQLAERWDNRLTFEGLSFAKDYADSRFAVVLYMQAAACGNWSHDATVGGNSQSKVGEHVIILVLKIDAGQADNLDHKDQKAVLVENVEFVQGPEGVIPTLMRSYVIEDDGGDLRGDSLYWSLINGVYKVLPRFVEREVGGRVAFAEVSQNLAEHMVQSHAEVVDDIADDKGKISGGLFGGLEPKEILSGFGVYIDAHAIGLRSDKRAQRGFKLIDMVVGPFDL